MLSAIFSDWHVHDYKQFNPDGHRLRNCIKAGELVYKFCHRNSIDTILFPGDLYDSEKVLPTEVVNEVVDFFERMQIIYPSIVMYAISGNHDQASKNTLTKPAITALTHIRAIAKDNFLLLDNSDVQLGDGITLHGIPYFEYPQDFQAALKERASQIKEGVNILMIHQTPKFLANSAIPFDMDPHDPLFEGFDFIYNGHIHQRQDMSDKFTTVGSLIHRDSGDAGDEKGFLISDLSDPKAGYKFISMKGKFPEYRSLAVPFGQDPVIPEEWRDDYVSIEYTSDKSVMAIEAKVEEFSSALGAQELMTNYWKEVDGKDEELLKTGLKLLSV